MMDNPGQLGADQVADAVAGIAGYPVPLILIDMGTATTASVVNSKKQYVGGMILPGVGVSLDALTARASQLSGISIDAPRHVIGKNTIECMKSGVLYSNAEMCIRDRPNILEALFPSLVIDGAINPMMISGTEKLIS